MEVTPLQSIRLSEIDPDKCWFNPGCALSIHNPATVQRLLTLVRQSFGQVKLHTLCCHHNPQLPAGSTIINNCAGCDRRFRSLYAGVNTITLWEVLDSMPGLRLPVYSGLTLSVQDPCSFRRKPQVHSAVRSLLTKMNIAILDSPHSGTRSICCGDNFYPRLPATLVNALQIKRAAQMPCQDVAVYCVSCAKSMAVGGKTPHHMADLVLGEPTVVGETNLDIYHAALADYICQH